MRLIKSKYSLAFLLISFSVIFIISCSKKINNDSAGTVLARIGKRIITAEDFIRRTEYSIRPNYCAGTTNIHKKIVLNSLIAEKLLALEEFSHSALDTNKIFQMYLIGQKEQAMRQILFFDQAVQKIEIDQNEIDQATQLALTKYQVEFISLKDSSQLDILISQLKEGKSIQSFYFEITGEKDLPQKEISWFSTDDPRLHQALFSKPLEVGDILEPIQTSTGSILFIKIIDKVKNIILSANDFNKHQNDVYEQLKIQRSIKKYESYAGEIMKGMQLQLNDPVFIQYAEMSADHYFQDSEDKKDILNSSVWELDKKNNGKLNNENIELLKSDVLFTLNDKDWTIVDLENYILRHPLLFRKKKIGYSEFPEQLKLAIADLIRDYFLTEKAYELGYDKSLSVTQYVELWQDHFLSRQQRNKYLLQSGLLSEKSEPDLQKIINQYLQPLIDSLQIKYSDIIEIDMKLFEELEMTSIPAFATRTNMPYPSLVPSFPMLTADHKIDYGSLRKN